MAILTKYSNNSNVFLAENVAELSKYTKINDYAIKLEKSKQLFFSPIYSLGPVELKTLKTYIEINLANDFIESFKFLARAPILFNRKPNKSLHFCVHYWGLNNIIIKN